MFGWGWCAPFGIRTFPLLAGATRLPVHVASCYPFTSFRASPCVRFPLRFAKGVASLGVFGAGSVGGVLVGVHEILDVDLLAV